MNANHKGYGYSINPSGEKFVFTREEWDELQTTTWLPLFEFFGTFKREKMEMTNAIVVRWDKSVLNRAEFLKVNYWIAYNDSVEFDSVCYVRYIFRNNIKIQSVWTFKKKMEDVFCQPSIEFGTGYPDTKKQLSDITYCNSGAFEAVLTKKESLCWVNSLNFVPLALANNLPIKEVADKAGIDKLTIDDLLNIEVSKWNCFSLLAEYYNSIELAMDFFKTIYEIEFVSAVEAQAKFNLEWVSITKSWDTIEEKRWCYWKYDDEWELKRLTDFIIKVHSTYITFEWYKQYTVSMINTDWEESERVIWENTAKKDKLAEFVQRYGNFHFYGTSSDVQKLHTLISNIKSPMIRTVVGYWWHWDICIFANGIWDKKKKEFIESYNPSTWVISLSNGDWVIVVNASWQRVDRVIPNKTSLFHVPQSRLSKAELFDFMKSIWKDDTGIVVWLIACSILWTGIAWLKKECPLYFFRGITQTGKTTTSEILQRLVWFPLGNAESFEWTLFTATLLVSSSYNLPVFFSEWRHKSRQMPEKVSMFRNAFDKTSTSRGKSDLTTAQFAMTSIVVAEWEEMIWDGATRTRFIQFRPNMHAKLDAATFEKRQAQFWKCNTFLHSYFTESNEDKYDKYHSEWIKIFSWLASSRNVANISHMYASAMIYAPELEEEFIESITNLLKLQAEDEKLNGTSIDIVKSISAFLQKKEYPVYIRDDWFVLSWESIQEYSRKYKQELSLSISSYREHLDALGYTVDYYEVREGLSWWEMLVEWPLFPYKNIDKRLLCNSEIYEQYKLHKQRSV